MTTAKANSLRLHVDLTNPGQFLASCGLLEVASQMDDSVAGWFSGDAFCLEGANELRLGDLLQAVARSTVANTMDEGQLARLRELASLPKKQLQTSPHLEEEKKALESCRREAPVRFAGPFDFRVDWFRDEFSDGSRFKTWAGQQGVLDIAQAMHAGLASGLSDEKAPWQSARGIGLPFYFDSDLGGQGSALDVGFSFDPLAGSASTRIAGTCRPALELLAMIGLQRFRPREIERQNRFVYTAWRQPLPPLVAAACVSEAVPAGEAAVYEFRLLYRTKYLKSFLPAVAYQKR